MCFLEILCTCGGQAHNDDDGDGGGGGNYGDGDDDDGSKDCGII